MFGPVLCSWVNTPDPAPWQFQTTAHCCLFSVDAALVNHRIIAPEQGMLPEESLKEHIIRRASPLKEESHGTSVNGNGMKAHLHEVCPDSVFRLAQLSTLGKRAFGGVEKPVQKGDHPTSHTIVGDPTFLKYLPVAWSMYLLTAYHFRLLTIP